MSKPVRHKLNTDINLTTTIEDEKHNSVGVSAFRLSELLDQDLEGSGFGHDWFCDLVINTAAGGAGTELVLGTDYQLSESIPGDEKIIQDIYAATGLAKTVYSKIQILNAAYQACDLYFSYTFVADDNDGEDLNNITDYLVNKAIDYAQSNIPGYEVVVYECGTATKIHTLPDAAKNKNLKGKIIKGDIGYGPVLVKLTGSDTINGLTHIFLWSQYDCIEWFCTGEEYIIINDFKPYFYSGWKNQSDWTNVHLGFTTITYDGLSGTIQLGDKCTGGTNGSYGIVIYDNGSTSCILASLVGGGGNIFENDETLSFDLSGASAVVNMASNLKNVDSNIYHGWSKNLKKLKIELYVSTSTDENNSFDLSKINYSGPTDGTFNLSNYQVDINNVKMQSGASGLIAVRDDTAGGLSINTQDYFYNILIKLV